MLYSGPADTHHIRTPVQTILRLFQYRFVFPPGHFTVNARSTLCLDVAVAALVGPVKMQGPAFVLRRFVSYQTLSCRTFILIVLGDVTEGITTELALGLFARFLWLG